MSHGIPDALSFERIISGGTCPVSATLPAESPCIWRSVTFSRTTLVCRHLMGSSRTLPGVAIASTC